MQIKKIFFSSFLLICFFFNEGITQDATPSPINSIPEDTTASPKYEESTTIFQKILQDSFYEVILETNFDSLIRNKKVSAETYPGNIIFSNQKESFNIKVKVSARGRARRKVCDMPPLKIDFPIKDLAKLGLFPGCDKLKLVTHCNDSEYSDQTLMKEYWIYKLYNNLTPNSYQVFPVTITYVNSLDPDDKMERFGFFIESNEGLAYRLGGELEDGFGIQPKQIEPESYHNTLMFQYMIGNVDWDIKVQRNVKVVRLKKDSSLLVVPYDFDYAALVRAPYARLNPDLKQTSLEQRFCLGRFFSKEQLLERAKVFSSLLDANDFKCYQTCAILHKQQKKKMNKYLGSFHKILKNEEELEEVFLNSPYN